MTYDEFLKEVQEYYGPYPLDPKIGSYVKAYLKRDINQDSLETLRRYVFYSHPHRMGPPGIAAIEKANREALYNHKGSDTHKPVITNSSQAQEIAEEYENGKTMVINADLWKKVKAAVEKGEE